MRLAIQHADLSILYNSVYGVSFCFQAESVSRLVL